MANSGYYTEPKLNASGGSSLTIREADGTPSGIVTELVFPNTSVSIAGGVGTLSLVVAGDLATIATTGSFTDLDDRPSTLSGYGITDAQPLDSDLTAIAALATTSYGRSFLTQADAAAGRTLLELGSSNDVTFNGITITETNPNVTPISSTGYSLTGNNAQSALFITGQWNTTGNPSAIFVDINDSVSGTDALLINLRTTGTSRFRVTKFGSIIAGGSLTLGASGVLVGGTNLLEQRNGTNGQISRIYKTFTSTSVFRTFEIDTATDADNTRLGSRVGASGGTDMGLQFGRYNSAGSWATWFSGTTAGNLVASNLIGLGAYTVATLPSASANAGHIAQVTDSSVTTNGSAVSGGGANRVMVFSNGTAWDVVVA